MLLIMRVKQKFLINLRYYGTKTCAINERVFESFPMR